MLWAQIALTLASLAVCTFAPGFLLVRRLPWRPLEKVCGAVAASLIILYLIALAVFCFAPGSETGIHRTVACVFAALAIWQWRDIRRLAQQFGARQALTGFGFLLAWSFPALAMIRNFSGAGWGGDWVEHFQRTLFFLHHLPTNIAIAGGYILPARPPMMNLIDAFFLAQTGDLFEIHQVVLTFLNLLAFLPCCLMLRAVLKSRTARYLPLTILFALNPMMMENAWYPWTKLLAVFYILFALWLYLAGLRKDDSVRIVSAFLFLAAGPLVHYSAGPYVVFLGGHYLLRKFVGPPHSKIRELAYIGIASALLLATWFGWSIRAYGVHDTFESNTSVSASQKYQGSTAGKIAGNLFNTIVPAILHNPESLSMFNQANKWGELRDNGFVLYQTNLIFGMGLVGGPFVLWLLYRSFRRPSGRPDERNFWLAFIPIITLLGIAVVGEPDLMGLAHLTLMPLEALGIILIAAWFPWSRAAVVFLLAGCAIDFSLGIFLHLRVENMQNTPGRTIYSGLSVQGNNIVAGAQGPDTLGGSAWLNWFWKSRDALHTQWIRQLAGLPQNDALQRTADQMKSFIAQNSRDFGGWYGRHGGRITFLGDHLSGPSFAGIDIPSVLFLLLFVGMMRALWKESLRLAPAAMPESQIVQRPAVRKKAAARRH
jgi:hypothetical protein